MKLEWLGHACFKLTNAEGSVLLTDPFDPGVGYPVPDCRADVVLMSHHHHDHDYTAALPAGFTTIDQCGTRECAGFRVTGIESFHDDAQGTKRGPNVLFVIETDGLRLAHLGDLGHPLSAEQARELGRLDVLMLPVGGFYTIDAQTAAGVCEQLKPRLTIPMHFKTPAIHFPIETEETFLKLTGGRHAHARALEFDRDTLEALSPVLALDYA